MEKMDYLEYVQENGFLNGIITVLAMIILSIADKRKEEIGEAMVSSVRAIGKSALYFMLIHNQKLVQKVTHQISSIYTYMYLLLDLSPVRIAVLRFEWKEIVVGMDKGTKQKEQRVMCYMMHEAAGQLQPLKEIFQGISIGKQTLDFWMTQTIMQDNQGLYIPNVEQMEKGDLRDLLESYDIKSFFNIFLIEKNEQVLTLFVAFNREDSLEPSGVAKIKLVAANIFKYVK